MKKQCSSPLKIQLIKQNKSNKNTLKMKILNLWSSFLFWDVLLCDFQIAEYSKIAYSKQKLLIILRSSTDFILVFPGPEVIKLFSCSTQPRMKFFLLINVKMPTIFGILTFMNRKNSLLHLSEPEKSWISWYSYTLEHLKFHAQLRWAWKKFYNLGLWSFIP